MTIKRDMYIDYKKNKNNKNNKRRTGRNKKTMFISAIYVILIVLVLGVTTFFVKGANLFKQDDTRNNQKELEMKNNSIPKTSQQAEAKEETKSDTKEVSKDGTNEAINTNKISQWNTIGYIGINLKNNPLGTFQVENKMKNLYAENIGIRSNVSNTDANIIKGIEKTTKESEEEVFNHGLINRRPPVKVKGIYVTGPKAGSDSSMEDLIELVDTTELNAMVIDIKNDNGEITYNMDLPMVKEIGANVNYISDIQKLIDKLKAKDIYLIARIVAFKDPILAEKKPELSIKKADGTIFRDKSGLSWVNPYKKEVWDYLIDVSKETAKLGFDEIQFDYIRFSTDSGMKNVNFGKAAKDKTKIEAITEFTKYAAEQLKPLGVYVSADVYGTIIDSQIDAKIVGQSYVQMSKYLDYISPMIYPSHYADGTYGIKHPDMEPYNLILKSLNKSVSALKKIEDTKSKADVRPWLQDFTAVWLDNHKSYGEKEIRAQIDAVYDAGYEQWILWNGSNKYTEDGLLEQ